MNRTSGLATGTFLFLLIAASGCVSLGPKTISRDRSIYDDQLAESWKKQMLLNIVKVRYADLPTFLDVSSIIAQYGLEQQISANVGVNWPKELSSNSAGVSGQTTYSDKPTITYTPLSGQKFTKNLLTPIPPMGLVSMIQSGWPADLIFSLCLKSINGVSNYTSRDLAKDHDDFLRLITFWRNLQNSDAIDFRIEKTGEKESLIFLITLGQLPEEIRKEIESNRDTLGLKIGASKYTLVFGKLPASDTEVALLTRSIMEIMIEMSTLIEIPQEHVQKKFVIEYPISGLKGVPLMRIRSGLNRPPDSFVAVPYHGYWFWIDNSDFISKRNFTLLMIFLSLTETEQKAGAGPLITI